MEFPKKGKGKNLVILPKKKENWIGHVVRDKEILTTPFVGAVKPKRSGRIKMTDNFKKVTKE